MKTTVVSLHRPDSRDPHISRSHPRHGDAAAAAKRVRRIIKHGRSPLTNTLFTMIAASNTKTLTAQVNATNGPLARLVPGDILQFVMTGSDTGQVCMTRNVSSP
jgi:hypothetical protein